MSDLDIASLRQIEHLQKANHVLDSVIEDLQKDLQAANERLNLFYETMRASAPTFGGPTHWSVRSSGWPWNFQNLCTLVVCGCIITTKM